MNWFDRQDLVTGFFNAIEVTLIGAAFGCGFHLVGVAVEWCFK